MKAFNGHFWRPSRSAAARRRVVAAAAAAQWSCRPSPPRSGQRCGGAALDDIATADGQGIRYFAGLAHFVTAACLPFPLPVRDTSLPAFDSLCSGTAPGASTRCCGCTVDEIIDHLLGWRATCSTVGSGAAFGSGMCCSAQSWSFCGLGRSNTSFGTGLWCGTVCDVMLSVRTPYMSRIGTESVTNVSGVRRVHEVYAIMVQRCPTSF